MQPPYAPRTYAGPAAVPPGQAPAARQQSAAPTQVRGQRPPDDPPPSERRSSAKASLTLPPPEQLGIGGASVAAEIDWNSVHRKLHELGSTSYQSQKIADGYRFSCLLPTADPGRSQRIEAQATGEAEAIRLALDRAEQWARGH